MMTDLSGKTNIDKYEKAVGKDSLVCGYELLSPAGNMDCLYAAISSGADAVYAGADRFSARAYAGNFDEEGLIKAIDYVHLFGKKLYLTLNTLIKEREFKYIYDFIKPFYEEGLDGVIIQDPGVAALLKERFPSLKLHASTQMSICTSYGARLAASLGIERIVPARELSYEEIVELKEESGLEVECFIHGAMCYSYSGQCLMSSFLGGRSANRGRCAGPCRLPYSCFDEKEVNLLSMKDMCTLDILGRLMDAGIDSFKIEGRMKPPEYVANVTSIYRKYMDLYISGDKDLKVHSGDRRRLEGLYSRGGISTGYYEKKNGPEMINKNSTGYKSLREEKEPYLPQRLKKDVRVFCKIRQGEPVGLRLEADGVVISLEGVAPDRAKTRALNSDDIKKQLVKTGDSDFNIGSLDIDTDGESFVPVSALNGLRRQGLVMMGERLNSGYKRSV